MRRTLTPLALAALALAAASTPAAAQYGCSAPESVALSISLYPIQVAPGERTPVGLFWFVGNRPADPLPRHCHVAWSVEPRGAGRISRGRVSAPASARPGSEFTLVARVGRHVARQQVHVVDPRPNPLASYWTQRDSANTSCTGGVGGPRPDRVRELLFRRDSAFSVTYVPWETRRDYWGTYSYNDSTGALRLRVESEARGLGELGLKGVARVEGDTLRLEGFWLGDPRQQRAGRTCTYVFARQR
ncbi:MAG TPA: hypothetical protein VEX86_27410 [Longimicrobium sp.]|nr:hypothetical protein [Longimicrobium sp.]